MARGTEPVVTGSLDAYDAAIKDNPDQNHIGLIFHENSISYEQSFAFPISSPTGRRIN